MLIVIQSSCTLLHDQCGNVKGPEFEQDPTDSGCPYNRQKTVVMRNVEDPSMEEQDGIYINC